MPRVISELCSNPYCTGRIDSEEVRFDGDRLWFADQVNAGIDKDARQAGWQRIRREWFCPRCAGAELRKILAAMQEAT